MIEIKNKEMKSSIKSTIYILIIAVVGLIVAIFMITKTLDTVFIEQINDSALIMDKVGDITSIKKNFMSFVVISNEKISLSYTIKNNIDNYKIKVYSNFDSVGTICAYEINGIKYEE